MWSQARASSYPPPAQGPFTAHTQTCRDSAVASSIPLRVSLVNLQKFTFQPCEDWLSMRMLAPAQKIRSFPGCKDHGAHLRMLEAEALDGVVQLDVHTEVVGVQLELVAGDEAAGFLDVHGQRRDPPVHGQLPVPVPGRLGTEVHHDARLLGHRLSPRYPRITQSTLAVFAPRFSQPCGLPPSR